MQAHFFKESRTMYLRPLFLTLVALSGATSANAFGDFPLASCKANNGTIVEINGVNTNKAFMKGIITKADINEYCERDPGGTTTKYGGKLTVNQCVAEYYAKQKNVEIQTTAHCGAQTLSFRYNQEPAVNVKFPLALGSDQSCASGIILCPKTAQRLKM